MDRLDLQSNIEKVCQDQGEVKRYVTEDGKQHSTAGYYEDKRMMLEFSRSDDGSYRYSADVLNTHNTFQIFSVYDEYNNRINTNKQDDQNIWPKYLEFLAAGHTASEWPGCEIRKNPEGHEVRDEFPPPEYWFEGFNDTWLFA